jgi:hypothetical protein
MAEATSEQAHKVTDPQKDLARPNQAQGDKLPQENNDVPNPVPATPTNQKDVDAISDATPGLAQAVTTLNPHARRQDSNRANDPDSDKPKDEVNINGQNVKAPVAEALNDPNFAKQNEEEATDEANNPIVPGKKLSAKMVRKLQEDAHDPNLADKFNKDSQDEKNNPTVQGKANRTPLHRKKNETQQEYNERVPVAEQPVLDASEFDYLGRKR